MLDKIDLKNILFLDIETVPEVECFSNLSKEQQQLFSKKTQYKRNNDEISIEKFYERAGIWAEFGKIICISVGYFVEINDEYQLRIKSFFDADEHQILIDFKTLLTTYFNKKKHILCAHNGKEFDFPYLARRMLIHRIKLPQKLSLFGKKPWEINHLDTMELWKFGDYKHFTSLQLLTSILNIPSPKDDIDASQVIKVYYQQKNLQRIVNYCEKDVIAVAQLVLRFSNKPILKESNIIKV